MIEIKSVEFKNFLSYGDDLVCIDLENLGPCLITGSVVDSEGDARTSRSNGAGKSSIVNAIIWCMFGRTMHSASPGDKILNWFTGKDCLVKVVMKNGDSITRIRTTTGTTEIIYVKDGNESQFTATTLSTSQNQQSRLAKDFQLDWEVFAGSAFFTQYGKPWLEMADVTRKQAIERLLHIDRFTLYSEIAKSKVAKADSELSIARERLSVIEKAITDLLETVNGAEANREEFEKDRKERINRYLSAAEEAKAKRDAIEKPDVEDLKRRWDLVAKVEQRISDSMREITSLDRKIASEQGDVDSKKRRINAWKAKGGKTCVECEQPIESGYVSEKAKPYEAEIKEAEERLSGLKSQRDTLQKDAKEIREKLESKKPKISLESAQMTIERWNRFDREIQDHLKNAEHVKLQVNPYLKPVDDGSERLLKYDDEKKKALKAIDNYNVLSKHYYYIQKAYGDRNKIKSNVLAEHVPFVNERLSHYLEIFGLDVRLELTPALGIKSNLWGYEFESGGERKRTDVALMFAMFDLHESIYGRQCNVMVLDEVDGRMDEDGVNGLIDIIKTDMANRVEAVLVISHKDGMQDVFPKEIHVKRVDRVSTIEL